MGATEKKIVSTIAFAYESGIKNGNIHECSSFTRNDSTYKIYDLYMHGRIEIQGRRDCKRGRGREREKKQRSFFITFCTHHTSYVCQNSHVS